ncbi:MAG: DUF4159 domain-containing protein [Alphaproteobacteria bacterium]
MFAFLSNILIVNPLILAALAALPVLWFLLRVTPPAPKIIDFPATRFLKDLIPENVSPSKTPWWLLLLRILIATLVILALAHPVYNPSRTLNTLGDIRLIISNDWASAQNWQRLQNAAADILAQAERENRNVLFIAAADYQEDDKQQAFPLISAKEAQARLKGLEPRAWPIDYGTLSTMISSTRDNADYTNVVLSSGLRSDGFEEFVRLLSRSGSTLFFKMENENLPLALKTPQNFSMDLQAEVITPQDFPAGITITVQARTQNGRILNSQNLQTEAGQQSYEVTFDIPDLLRNDAGQFIIAGAQSAASVYLLDERFRKRSVGIAAAEDKTDSAAALTQAATYIRKAIEPYTLLNFGSVQSLIEQDPSMIILPDIGAIPSQTLNDLEEWVNEGGLLLRFAGPNMVSTLNTPYLVPVPIRDQARSLEGSLSWEEPLKLQDFKPNSPFFGLQVSPDITVTQQVLADPIPDLDKKTWALLEDGTPLITADKKGNGLIVLIHTTASPEWSNLPLSGLFVSILKRLVDISGKAGSQVFNQNSVLDPLYILNGFGKLQQAESTIKPIPFEQFDTLEISAAHPPGIYGSGGLQKILNMGDRIDNIPSVQNLPMNFTIQNYGQDYEFDLRPYLLLAATLLLFLDWLIMIFMATGLRFFDKRAVIGISALFFLVIPLHPASAQDILSGNEDQYKYADDLYLAYIKTGDASLDKTTQEGLNVLAKVLTRRTSAEPKGVVGLEPESDILPFFPFLYWPVSASASALSSQAIQNIQHYLDNGGTILFDTRDRNFTAGTLGGTPNADALRTLVGNLNIPPLQPAPKNHVLAKSFYLLDHFPGKYTGGTLWVESDSAGGRDGVSSVLIGSHDWAASWATNASNRRTIYGKTRQDELSLRFGVNLMMYALTGNYKADQVHVPHILERLGQ